VAGFLLQVTDHISHAGKNGMVYAIESGNDQATSG